MSSPRSPNLYVGGKPRTAQPADAMQVLAVRLVRLAHSWETAHQQHGRAGAAALIRRNAGSELDPRLAAVFVAEEPALLAAIDDPRIFDRFLEIEPGSAACADERSVDDVARALAILADLRCPMFFGHSTSVAALAERAAGHMGLSADDARSLRRAALLHDIGRLGVPNSIWTRPGRLDWGEMERVRLHAYYTERVLSPIRVLGTGRGDRRLGARARRRVRLSAKPHRPIVAARCAHPCRGRHRDRDE